MKAMPAVVAACLLGAAAGAGEGEAPRGATGVVTVVARTRDGSAVVGVPAPAEVALETAIGPARVPFALLRDLERLYDRALSAGEIAALARTAP
jgi:hypothetical protein